MTLSFSNPPCEMLFHIFYYLNIRELIKTGEVCNYWKQISDTDLRWNAIHETLSLYSIGLNVPRFFRCDGLSKGAFYKMNIQNFINLENSECVRTAFKATLCLYKIEVRNIEHLLTNVKRCDPYKDDMFFRNTVDELLRLINPDWVLN